MEIIEAKVSKIIKEVIRLQEPLEIENEEDLKTKV